MVTTYPLSLCHCARLCPEPIARTTNTFPIFHSLDLMDQTVPMLDMAVQGQDSRILATPVVPAIFAAGSGDLL